MTNSHKITKNKIKTGNIKIKANSISINTKIAYKLY